MTTLLLGLCLSMPLFDDTGPVCPTSAQVEECRCTECMTWNPSQETSSDPLVRYYDIERTEPGGGFSIVGGTWRQDWIDDDLGAMTTPPSTIWCFARDNPMPREGLLYGYRVRACNLAGCSAYDLSVEYVAAPYAIDSFRPPVQGNR